MLDNPRTATQILKQSPAFLCSCLKGTVNLLQHVYGDVAEYSAASYLKEELQGGGALSTYLINLISNLHDFVRTISTLSDQNISDPDMMGALIGNLLQSTGLSPLLPLLSSDGPINASQILHVASQVGRLNQHIFSFNETDPTMPELEQLIMQVLSLEGNLTMSLSHIMGSSLITYSNYLHPDEVARLREAIQPFTNQTSAGVVEAILSAMELLQSVTDSPDGDPTVVLLAYIRQLHQCMVSLYRLRKIEQVLLPNGQLSEVTDLNDAVEDFLNLLSPESLLNLTHAGPDAAQELVAQTFLPLLPPELQEEAALFFKRFQDLQYHLTLCSSQNCLEAIPKMFTFLDEILELMLSSDSNVTVNIAVSDTFPEGAEYEEIATMVFSLLLSPNDAADVETFQQTLHFIKLVMATPNVSVSQIKESLEQSNLTIKDLNYIANLAGSANVNELLVNSVDIADVSKCFDSHNDTSVTARCLMGLITKVSSFLTNIPALRNETAIVSLVPFIVNKTMGDIIHMDFGSNTYMALIHTLNKTMANIKMNLQMSNLMTPEIMNEITVVEGLLKIASNPEPLNYILHATSAGDPMYANKAYLVVVQWYLERLENVTSTSSMSELLGPFLQLTQMQVTMQLAQVDLSLFVSHQIEHLIENLHDPIDGSGVVRIVHTLIKILQREFDYIENLLGDQFDVTQNFTAETQLYLNLIKTWMNQSDVPLILTRLLQWGNMSDMWNVSNPLKDLQLLLHTTSPFLGDEVAFYISIINNITQSLNKAVMVAEQPGGLQIDHLSAAVLEAVQSAMQILSITTGPLPLSVHHDLQEIVQDTLMLFLQPELSFATSRNISLGILEVAERVIQQTLPEMYAVYLVPGLKVATTYFETVSSANGPDNWNQM